MYKHITAFLLKGGKCNFFIIYTGNSTLTTNARNEPTPQAYNNTAVYVALPIVTVILILVGILVFMMYRRYYVMITSPITLLQTHIITPLFQTEIKHLLYKIHLNTALSITPVPTNQARQQAELIVTLVTKTYCRYPQ